MRSFYPLSVGDYSNKSKVIVVSSKILLKVYDVSCSIDPIAGAIGAKMGLSASPIVKPPQQTEQNSNNKPVQCGF